MNLEEAIEIELEESIICKAVCFTCGNDCFDWDKVKKQYSCDTCGQVYNVKTEKETEYWSKLRKHPDLIRRAKLLQKK